MRRNILWGLCIATVMSFAHPVQATLITFDNMPATVVSEVPAATTSGFAAVRTGALMSLEFVVDGVTVTITRQGGAQFDIVDNVSLISQQGKSASFGSRSLDPFFDTNSNAPFIFSFSAPIKVFSILGGDYGGYDTDYMTMIAYTGENGTGAQAGSVIKQKSIGTAGTWSQKRFDISNPDGFQSVSFTSVGLRPNNFNTGFSVFLDRMYFNRGSTEAPPDWELDDPNNHGSPAIIIPEPATLALLALGSTVMLYRRRR